MKQGKIIAAYNTIENLRKQDVRYPSTVSMALFRTKKALEAQYEFQSEEEKKLVEELNPTQEDNGTLKFASEEDAQKFVNRMREINDIDVDLDYTKQKIKLRDEFGLTLDEIETLDPFIEFDTDE